MLHCFIKLTDRMLYRYVEIISLLLYLVVVMVLSPSLRSSHHNAHHYAKRDQHKIYFGTKCQVKRYIMAQYIIQTKSKYFRFTLPHSRLANTESENERLDSYHSKYEVKEDHWMRCTTV